MSRWSRRHARRQQPPAPSPLPIMATLDLPPGCPDDVRELARMVAAEGPGLLAGLDPWRHGLIAVHPRSPACPNRLAPTGQMAAFVVPLAQLEAMARKNGLTGQARSGWFFALLFGATRSACLHLKPAEADRGAA